MYPILFTWDDAALYTYMTLFSVAVVLGFWLWIRESSRLIPQASKDSLINAALLMIIAGLFGAKALFVLTNLELYREGVFQITKLGSGGIVFYGGMIGGLIALCIWTIKNRFPVITTLSAMTPALAFGHALGRLGCFAHGCCHGAACHLPWGVAYHDPQALARPLGVPLHPTQIYEFLGLIAIGTLCLKENKRFGASSRSFAYYLLSYGTLRFFVEFFRADSLRGEWGGLSTSQWVSLAMIISCLFLDFARPSDHNSAHENRT
jgi:phosphatidylglycerol---prolipoprotein diacylglyceryl transferase